MATATKKKPNAKKASAPKTVLVLRTCDKDGKSNDGAFQWPESGEVVAPDWQPTEECGNGLHGWLWGAGNWSLKSKCDYPWWYVVEVDESEFVDLGDKIKFPRCTIVARFKHWREAMAVIRGRLKDNAHGVLQSVATKDRELASATGYSGHASATGNYGHASATGDSGHASATGDSGHASATGDSGHASATGDYGHASATGHSGHASATGDYGHASATGDSGHASATGDYGHASATGDYGHASATGDSGHASATGDYGWAIAGRNGKAKAAANGVLTLLYWDDSAKRTRVAVGYVGEDGIEPNTWYRVVNGKIVEATA